MNLEEARTVLWLKNNPRIMGDLFDEGYLTKERLEWAVRKAYTPRQREAAKVLSSCTPLQSKPLVIPNLLMLCL